MQKIIIRNFGPIQDLDLEINSFLILIGEQATGKSTIAKLIFFFKSLRHDMLGYLYQKVDIERSIEEDFFINFFQKFTLFFGSIENLSSFQLLYRYSQNRYVFFVKNKDGTSALRFMDTASIEKEGEESKKYFSRLCKQIYTFRATYIHANTAFFNEEDRLKWEIEKTNKAAILRNEINNFFSDKRDTVFIPAARSILATLNSQISVMDTQRLDFLMRAFIFKIQAIKGAFGKPWSAIIQEARNQGKELPDQAVLDLGMQLIEAILKGEYQNSRSGEKIYYKGEQYVPLHFASSGQQEVVWILMQIFIFLLNKEQVFLVIEEPEAHLHPLAQKKMMELIALLKKETDSQIIITTHSPYILTSFNNLIYAGQLGRRQATAVSEVIDPLLWVDGKTVSAKQLTRDAVVDLMDEELGLVRVEEIDRASALINQEFDQLFNLDEL